MSSSKSAQMVKSIRQGQSDEYSLNGFDAKQLGILARDAFTEPIPAKEMIRFTFVVGGGKNVRSKFDSNLGRDFSAALRGISYDEDRSASCLLDSQGTFKFQHNTDTDLKTMTVFPRVTIIEVEDTSGPRWMVDGHNVITTPPELVSTFCTMINFVQLVVELCPTFTQRSTLLIALKGVQVDMDACEAKLANMEQLSPQEDTLYGLAVSLPEKINALQTQTQNMVISGTLTAAERQQVITKMTSKRDQLILQEQKIEAKIKKSKVKSKGSKKKLKARLAKLSEHIDQISETIEGLEAKRPTKARRRAPVTPYQRKIDKVLSGLYNRRDSSMSRLETVEDEIALLEFKRGGWYPTTPM